MCKVSPELLLFLKVWEGVRTRVYLDSVKKPTVGVGHLVLPSDHLKVGDVITHARVDAFLTKDVQSALKGVNQLVKARITKNQCIALTSFVFNLGQGRLASSTLLIKLNGGDYKGAADQFLRWTHAGGKQIQGLVNRRNAERALFLAPDNINET